MQIGLEDYKAAITANIKKCIAEKGVQPILFLGSGVPRRYFGAPDWAGLLTEMASHCPLIDKAFAYYEQSYQSMRHIGQAFAEFYKEWAWGEGKSQFPDHYYSKDFSHDVFIKHKISMYLESITPTDPLVQPNEALNFELTSLQKVRPHAIITTNYDRFIERLFPEYEPIIGQKILRSWNALFGEIYKIHGCVTDPTTIVLTESDYDEFLEEKKYLSAKLLTLFLEHPLIFIGYRAEDPNITAILSDIDIILSNKGELIPNLFILRRPRQNEDAPYALREEVLSLENNRTVRINSIVASDFGWVFDAFTTEGAIERVRPAILRSLLARTYDLVRYDIPKRTVEVDYSVLENALNNKEALPQILGITITGGGTQINKDHPWVLSQIAEQLGFPTWHKADKLLQRIKSETGKDMKSYDNKYHVAIKPGQSEKNIVHKYSRHALNLLRSITENPSQPIRLDEG